MCGNIRKLWTKKLKEGKVSLNKPITFAKNSFEGRVLGIDPSLRATGLAVIEASGKNFQLVSYSTVKLGAAYSAADCLGKIFLKVSEVIENEQVNYVALESTVYVQNFKIAHQLGASRGVAIAAANLKGIAVAEYAPLRVKKAVVGFGAATKDQVAKTVCSILNAEANLTHDESDAAAVAVCHILQSRLISQ